MKKKDLSRKWIPVSWIILDHLQTSSNHGYVRESLNIVGLVRYPTWQSPDVARQ